MMQSFLRFTFFVLYAAGAFAGPTPNGRGTSKNSLSPAYRLENQGTLFGVDGIKHTRQRPAKREVADIQARHGDEEHGSDYWEDGDPGDRKIKELAKRLKKDGYHDWCRWYLHLPEYGATKTVTKTKTKHSTALNATTEYTTTTVPNNVTVTFTSDYTTTTTIIVNGTAITATVTSTVLFTETAYNATSTSWTLPPTNSTGITTPTPAPRMAKRQDFGAAHHLKEPPYAQKYTQYVIVMACGRIVNDKPKTTTTKVYTTTTKAHTKPTTITRIITTTAPPSNATVTATYTATATSVLPGFNLTTTVTTTSTTTTFAPGTRTIVANPCNTAEATWHLTDEGYGPCCADWSPRQEASAYDCCVKCWNTPGCPAWFYGLPIEGSWQAGYCWTPGYVEPPSGGDAKCPAGKIEIGQTPPYEGVEPDLVVAQGPCFAAGGPGNWDL